MSALCFSIDLACHVTRYAGIFECKKIIRKVDQCGEGADKVSEFIYIFTNTLVKDN